MSTPTDMGAKRPFLPRRIVPLIIVLLVMGLLSLLLRDFFRGVIFVPLVEFLLYYYRLYRLLGQNAVWAFLIVLLSLLALRTLWRRQPEPTPTESASIARQGRLTDMARLAAEAQRSDYARWQLAQALEELTVQILQQHYGQPADVIRSRIDTGEIGLPAPVRAVFDACAAIPNYRSFHAARQSGRFRPHKSIPQLANLDFDAALQTLEEWE